jgi:protein phosphatase
MASIEQQGNATVVWSMGFSHTYYEDYAKLYCHSLQLVDEADRGEILVVCDGVSSAPKGKEAAQEVCLALEEFFDSKEKPSVNLIKNILLEVNEKIYSWGCVSNTKKPMGATVATVAWIDNDRKLHVLHVGDTRLMVVRDGAWKVMTSDHQNEQGYLINFFGREKIHFQESEIQLKEDDKILLCSDGLTKALTNAEIVTVMSKYWSRSSCLNALERLARQKGVRDDITIILFNEERF